MPEKTFRILSIDAWRDSEGGWTWNQWFKIGDISETDFNAFFTKNGWQCDARKLFAWMRAKGYLAKQSAGKVSHEDDQTNIVICARGTGRPLMAIEYDVGQ